MTPDDVRNTVFSKPSFGRRGYDEDAVDAFLDRIEQTLRGADHLTPADVRNVAFAKASRGRRGYVEDEVDAFLDLAEQALAHRETPPGPQLAPPLDQPRKRWWQGG
ncbi:DivIVA domain-containing protein [Amycolatopsis albispora]|uniref:DivIVA domain-containing protein n=1 Tax=Amycolatopsis albispora TaxID=1804986 RepID=UPI000DE42178|nr:DivIVA domain-containing protein [Amycolatopsis albispora]